MRGRKEGAQRVMLQVAGVNLVSSLRIERRLAVWKGTTSDSEKEGSEKCEFSWLHLFHREQMAKLLTMTSPAAINEMTKSNSLASYFLTDKWDAREMAKDKRTTIAWDKFVQTFVHFTQLQISDSNREAIRDYVKDSYNCMIIVKYGSKVSSLTCVA